MKKLRIVLAGILLTLPLFAISAGTLVDKTTETELQQAHSLTGWCYVFMNGKWYVYPC